jgi:predicted NBD/HSP70 family sugar kinase
MVDGNTAGLPELAYAADGPRRLKGRSHAETRSAVLDLIRSEGEISRIELARRSELTEKTISVIVKVLLDSGVIVESGFGRSTGGKRPVLLRLSEGLYAVGVTIDVAHCVLVLCALDGTEVARREVRGTGSAKPAAVLRSISATLHRLLKRRGIDKNAVVGVCLAVGGRESPLGWRMDTPDSHLWGPYPTGRELARLTGLTVLCENDANCAALGEYWATGTPGRDFLTVYMAHGIGAGIVIGGSIYKGASGNAGELGHLLADAQGARCWCGRTGCLDTVASPRAVTQQVLRSPELMAACGIDAEMGLDKVYQRFGARVLDGVAPAVELFERAAGYLAEAVLDLVNALDLDLVVLVGPGFAELGEQYHEAVDRRLRECAITREEHAVSVRLGVGGADAAALGAASVVLHRGLTPHHASAPL